MKKHVITPNVLTVFRIILTALLIYFLFIPSLLARLCVGALFIVAVLTDFYDGYLARKYNLITNFGKIADPIADKLLILGLYISFGVLGIINFAWLVPIIIREILITGLRLILLTEGKVVAAEKMGKIKVGFQVASIVAAWLVLLMQEYLPNYQVMAVYQVFLVPFYGSLLCAVVITVYSGLLFLHRNRSSLADVGIARCVGTFCYLGNVPLARGTVGSIGAVIVYVWLWPNTLVYLTALVAAFLVGTWSARVLAELRNNSDPQEVVIDEVVGMWLTLFLLPFSLFNVVVGFMLFRCFDIVKPWPIRKFESVPRGYGVMLDDVAAGVLANVVLRMIGFLV